MSSLLLEDGTELLLEDGSGDLLLQDSVTPLGGSAIHVSMPWRCILPFPTGTVTQPDRQEVPYMYSGISALVTATGGMIKRRQRGPVKRYEIEIDGELFSANSPQALAATVARWRRDHPVAAPSPIEPIPKAKPRPVVVEIAETPQALSATPKAVPLEFRPRQEFPGASLALAALAYAEMDRRAAEIARQAQEWAVAQAEAIFRAEDEDDIEALTAILQLI